MKVRINGDDMPYTTFIKDIDDTFKILGVLTGDIEFVDDNFDYVKIEDGEDKKLVKYDCPCSRKDVMPDKVIFNDKCTIAFHDNEKVIVKCDDEDKFSKVFGFLYAYFLMNSKMTKSQAKKFFDQFCGCEIPKKKNVSKEKKVEELLNDKSLSIDEFEKRMRNLLDDYMA